MNIRKLSPSELLNVISITLMMSFFFFPYMTPYFRVITFYGAYFLWLLSCYIIDRHVLYGSRRTWVFLCFLFLAALMMWAFNSNSSHLRRFITTVFISYNWGWALCFYRDKKYLFRTTLPWILFMFLFGSISTYFGCLHYPMASRILATGAGKYDSSLHDMYKKMGIGGYDFIYSFVFILPSIMCLIKSSNRIIYKSFLCVVILIGSICVLQSGYSTGILFMLIAFFCTLILLMSKSNNPYPSLIFMLSVLIVVWIYRLEIISFIGYIGDSVGAYYVSTRMNQLGVALSTGGVESLDRFQLYHNAFVKFLDSPIFGELARESDLGLNSGHSEVLNYLEVYGIGGISFVFFLIKSFTDSWKTINNKRFREILIINQFLIFIFACINRIDSANGVCMIALFIAPIIAEINDEDLLYRYKIL